jgi:phage terminase large subunit-like protein
MLAEDGLPMVEFVQTNSNMAPASQHLFELFSEGRIVHNGDERFRSHVLSAVASETERGWRISKRRSKERIDACVSLAMAAERAVVWKIGQDDIDPEDYRIQSL